MYNTMKITIHDQLKMHRKANRECTVRIKPVITTDKKKKHSKEFCRKFKF
jgi:hypothetical protein